MLSLGTGASTTILASTASYFTAHCFAYMQEGGQITKHCSAANALAMARNPAVLESFLTIQKPSALGYFIEAKLTDYPRPTALATTSDASSERHAVDKEQFPLFTALLKHGATELTGAPMSWSDIAALEVEHARLASNTDGEPTKDFSRLGIAFGKSGLERRALLVFYNEVLSSSDFRPSAPDKLETDLNRIVRFSKLARDMSEAQCREKSAEYFMEVVSLTLQIPADAVSEGIPARAIALNDILECLTKSQLLEADLRQLWYDLKGLIATLPESTRTEDLRKKLDTLL